MNYWIEKTLAKGRPDRQEGNRSLGKALWSPQKDKRGADIYKNMREVEIGDVIIHLIDNTKIVGVSIAKTRANKSVGISGTDWEGPAYLIELENYEKLNPEIPREEILNQKNKPTLDEINSKSEVFYNSKLDLRQGAYLTPCPNDLVILINDAYNRLSDELLPHVDTTDLKKTEIPNKALFDNNHLAQSISVSGLTFSKTLLTRFCASLLTKPFVILTGLSGSGKTKIAQAFAKWICASEEQYALIPVGADWTNREPLLGYPNALKENEYVKPDNKALDLLIKAKDDEKNPYFLILDEMNLSHVERYFADFLSTMESEDVIPLHDIEEEKNEIPKSIKLPKNLFIVGTVNIDETTYMFSPKVLDRANTIEFRVDSKDIGDFLKEPKGIDLKKLEKQGAGMAENFVSIAIKEGENYQLSQPDIIIRFFEKLQKSGAEFGYRTAFEISKLIFKLDELGMKEIDEKVDVAIMQKMLPKLHGSRTKLQRTLKPLAKVCLEVSEEEFEAYWRDQEN